jgi:pimeloyl-ACP methyl ester carboxylesterase
MAETKAFRAIMIHGVGEQGPGFAEDARQWLRQACGKRGLGTQILSAHWAPLADKTQARLRREAEARGHSSNPLRRLVDGTLADALYYQDSPRLQDACHDVIDRQVARLAGQPFTIFAHSLGGLIATDWLRKRPLVKGVRLVTFGCNLDFFNQDPEEPFQPVPQLRNRGSWFNFFYPRDMLGAPLAGVRNLEHVADVRLWPPAWIFSTGLCHTRYWTHKRLWAGVIPAAIFR